MSTLKLEPNSDYKIISYKTIQTKFGTSHVLKADDFNEYFSNKKISDWIMKNKPKGEFKIKTSELKTFTKDDQEIKFIDVIIKS